MLRAMAVILDERDQVDDYSDLSQEIGGADRMPILLARASLADRFRRQSKAFQLRALMEGWDLSRIVREMY